MKDLIVIPEENIDIFMPSYFTYMLDSPKKKNSLSLKAFLTFMVYTFVFVMVLWLFGFFKGAVEVVLTFTYVGILVSGFGFKIIKLLGRQS